ncbi:MAG: endonuclease/exonuclease/phosphatase family protein [Verrucomicrobiae bacterium]|nr:endonuclease/exonuclease/phosphatase family protein [Verrucomicrobiae bacterium]
MKFYLSLLILVLTFHSQALTVMSWNLEWFPGRNPHPSPLTARIQMSSAQKTLKQLNPDVLIGLELRDWKVFNQLISVIPDMRVQVVSAFRFDDSGDIQKQQIGIASRLPANSAWFEPWKVTSEKTPRGFSFAALEDPKSKKLLMIYGLHLKSNRGSSDPAGEKINVAMRHEAVRQLLEHITKMESVYHSKNIKGWIVAGDFNTNDDNQFKGDQTIAKIKAAGFWDSWNNTPPAKRQTWRGGGPFSGTTFDYILTKKLGFPKAIIADAPSITSDHLPVLITF